MGDNPYQIQYDFHFVDGKKKRYSVFIDPETGNIILPRLESKPDWVKLDNNQCNCCPFTIKDDPYCPVARNIAVLVEEFKEIRSYENCTVQCTTPERVYTKDTTVMEGLSSIFGAIMATSRCPVMAFLKPMVRFHLPFSTSQETVLRVTSIYLLRQYFQQKKNKPPDFDLQKLEEYYDKIKEVNEGLMQRISSVVKKDAGKNAIHILHSFAQMLTMQINLSLSSLEPLFH